MTTSIWLLSTMWKLLPEYWPYIRDDHLYLVAVHNAEDVVGGDLRAAHTYKVYRLIAHVQKCAYLKKSQLSMYFKERHKIIFFNTWRTLEPDYLELWGAFFVAEPKNKFLSVIFILFYFVDLLDLPLFPLRRSQALFSRKLWKNIRCFIWINIKIYQIKQPFTWNRKSARHINISRGK